MFYSSLEKLTAIVDAHDRLKAISVRDKGKEKAKEDEAEVEDVEMEDPMLDKQTHGWRDIEQAMPVHSVAFANESLESFWKGEVDVRLQQIKR
jgi:transformation/transcription domain-associated protein